MADSILGCVIEQLANEDQTLRDLALNWLCEGYMDDPEIVRTIYTQWDHRSPEAAFTSFPLLSYLPIHSNGIQEACNRATAMALSGGELTRLTTRCGGKLLEQTVRLPASQLSDHFAQIDSAIASHKIFFRIHADELRSRIDLLNKSADDVAELLDCAVERLAQDPDDAVKMRQGLHALEVLRLEHPTYMDLPNLLRTYTAQNPMSEASLKLALASLAQFTGSEQFESDLSPLLQDPRESVLALAIEALVRRGTGQAAQALVNQFEEANEVNRRWIARGLQRMRIHNLAPIIGSLRSRVSDQSLWLMLLTAELQQLDPTSGPRIVEEMQDLESASQALIDAGILYTFVCSPLQQELEPIQLEECFRDFLKRVHSHMAVAPTPTDIRLLRKQQSRQIDKLYNKRRRT